MKNYPECSGNPSSCPENEGYGCCQPNPKCAHPPIELIERVAIAICPWDNGVLHNGSPEIYWRDMTDKFKAAYRDQAKAAIAAMGASSPRATGVKSTEFATREDASQEAPANQCEISDVVTTLPFDIKIGAVVFRKGISVQTLINAAERWQSQAVDAFLKDVDIESAKAALIPPAPVPVSGCPINPESLQRHQDIFDMGVAHAKTDQPDESAWMIFYEDVDRLPECFFGAGAKNAAVIRFNQISASWNATLFKQFMNNFQDALSKREVVEENGNPHEQ